MEPDFKEVERIIAAALAEDIGTGDVTSELTLPPGSTATLMFTAREPLVACGLAVAARTLASLAPHIHCTPHLKEADRAEAGDTMMEASGPAHALLAGERTALNLMQRMSAVATLTSRYVQEVQGTDAIILDTRKTMPGLRSLDKYAVRIGGGQNHRMRLDDAILIKDNHIAVCGGVRAALRHVQAGNTRGLPVEIECDTLSQVQEALQEGAQRILLDNMTLDMLRDAVALAGGRCQLEASGNIRLENVRETALTGVDFISVGRLTHSAPNVDIGLDIRISALA